MATYQSQREFSLEKSVIGASSDYRFITSGGVDNFVANVLAFYALPGSFEELRPVEFLINNYFLHLDGRKFSTSSGHAVTVEQAAEKYEVNALRLYLTTIDVSHQASDFRRTACDEFMQNVFSPMMERLSGFDGKYRLCGIPKFREGAILSLLYRSLEQMGVSLDFRNYQLQSLVGILDRYISGYAELVTDDVSYSEFVLGFCLLAAPVMPDMVEKLMLPAWGKVKLNITEFLP
jgi:methionyl-tRNA synthetase